MGTGRLLTLTRAAAHLDDLDLYWAGRATLVSRREHLAVYDRAFARLVGAGATDPPSETWTPVRRVAAPLDGLGQQVDPGDSDAALASPAEALRRKDFAACSPDELEALARLMARLRLRAPVRRTRRRRPATDGEPDLRRTLRRALRTGGEPMERAWRRRRCRRRRLVLVLDVSGSMTAYSRALALFAYSALRADPTWEVFAFGTRLTRLTGVLEQATPGEVFDRLAASAADWDGGTRIGDSVRALIDDHGRGATVRGAVCVILSDGLDVGDPGDVRAQMGRLARLAHTVVWLNPLKGDPAYAPLARGMAAALPHVDVFRAGHNLKSLEELAEVIARL